MSYHVEEFTGYAIGAKTGGGSSRETTDWHVVDERGRTSKVFPASAGEGALGRSLRHAEAIAYAARLNVGEEVV